MEDITGLSVIPKIWTAYLYVVVAERSYQQRSHTVRSGGALGSENAGTSNHKTGENPVGRKSKVSWAMVIIPGLVGPKPRRVA